MIRVTGSVNGEDAKSGDGVEDGFGGEDEVDAFRARPAGGKIEEWVME